MSTDNPDISMLRREKPTPPATCKSCDGPLAPHNGECRCS